MKVLGTELQDRPWPQSQGPFDYGNQLMFMSLHEAVEMGDDDFFCIHKEGMEQPTGRKS